MCGRFPEVYAQRVDRQEYWQCHNYHGKEEVFPDEWDDKRCRRVDVWEEEEEHSEGQEDRDGQGDLLPAVWGQVEHQHCQTGNRQTRHDEVKGVEQWSPAERDVEHDVRIRDIAAGERFHPPRGRHIQDVPLHVEVDVF